MTDRDLPAPVEVLIADDEALARHRIVELLTRHDSVRIVGQSTSGPETLHALERLEPDVLFLDVQMPGLNGFEVLASIDPGDRPVVIFSTAYDEHAIQAFEVNAVDYLLKPYADDRFDEAFARARRAIRSEHQDRVQERLRHLLEGVVPGADPAAGLSTDSSYLERFAVPTRGQWIVVPASSVDWIEAAGDYVTLHVGSEEYLLRGTMVSVEARLDPRSFLRIHRSTIVRLDRVRSIESGEHGDYRLLMHGGEELRVSRGYRDAVLERLGVRR